MAHGESITPGDGVRGLTYIAEPLRGLAVPLADLHPDPSNARRHDDKNIEAIIGSLHRFGQRIPIVVQRQGMVVRAGNGRLEAAKRMGWTHLAAVVVDEGSVDATAYAIADNRTAELAEWDDETLAALLQSLPEDVLPASGFDEDDLKELLNGLTPEIVEDEAPEPLAEAVTRTGDVWLMGSHRLLCGDSTKAESAASVTAGVKPLICFTSPPYAQQRDYTAASREHTSDWDALMGGVFAVAPLDNAAQVFVNLGLVHRDGEWMPYWDAWIERMRESGWRRFGWYVWDQGPGMPGDWQGRFAPSHEFVFHFNRVATKPIKARACVHAGESHGGKGMRGADGVVTDRSHGRAPVQDTAIHDSVIRVNRQGASAAAGGHPAPYPAGLPARVIGSWAGDVYEPFSGSGTTIVACEQLDRACYAIEIAPVYVDVAVRRWEKLTGKQATLESTGKTWRETAEERGVNVNEPPPNQ